MEDVELADFYDVAPKVIRLMSPRQGTRSDP
jgi:hypothetical protein